MVKTNKEIVDRLESEAVIAAWDKGEDETNLIVTKCEDCRFREWHHIIEGNKIYCNKLKTMMEHDNFCSCGVKYNIDDEQRTCISFRGKK